MTSGMLWLDDSKRELAEKVERAVAYFADKYGQQPDLCLVNAGILAEEIMVGSVRVIPAPNIIPHHFFIGQADGLPEPAHS